MQTQTVGIHQLSFSNFRKSGIPCEDSPELRRRIQDHGFIEPIVVRPKLGKPGHYEVISNPESVVAAGKLCISDVPVVIREDLDDEEAAAAVRAKYQSSADNPINEAEWFKEYLEELGVSNGGKPNIASVARLTNKSRTHVSRSLALLNLPLDVQELFRTGKLEASHGRFLIKQKSSAVQTQLAKRAVRDKLTVRQLEALVNKREEPKVAVKASKEKDPDTQRLERRLTELVGSPVDIDIEKGILSFNYFRNLEALDGILQRLGYRDG